MGLFFRNGGSKIKESIIIIFAEFLNHLKLTLG
jgi:hypothetical protein